MCVCFFRLRYTTIQIVLLCDFFVQALAAFMLSRLSSTLTGASAGREY